MTPKQQRQADHLHWRLVACVRHFPPRFCGGAHDGPVRWNHRRKSGCGPGNSRL